MCGIAGIINLKRERIEGLHGRLAAMNSLQAHRGPDGEGSWSNAQQSVGLAHRRLSIIDHTTGGQPMRSARGDILSFNGEIYNYRELRKELGEHRFLTNSDTEVILVAYETWGESCVEHLRGMFAFILWDSLNEKLFCARDRVGIKPLYYSQQGETLYLASEAKAILPFLKNIALSPEALKEYLYFQFCLEGKTLFSEINELEPGYLLTVHKGKVTIKRYWQLEYAEDTAHNEEYFLRRAAELCEDAISLHTRSDVPIGAYVSGGLDSTGVAALTKNYLQEPLVCFTGKFSDRQRYDESQYARDFAHENNLPLHELEITSADFLSTIHDVIYHLDHPVAGPGAVNQYLLSQLVSKYRKVIVGGQGGDEIFGGYVRYLIAHVEHSIHSAIEGAPHAYQALTPFLPALKEYKPMLAHFWSEGLFSPMEDRYFRLINRSPLVGDEVQWNELNSYDLFATYKRLYNTTHIQGESHLNRMMHFDFKTILPALLQIEDRVSMAHGVESRVPLLDHPLVEFLATVPSAIKFKQGTKKHVFRSVIQNKIPQSILARKDKMGFPIPFAEWMQSDIKEFMHDTFSAQRAKQRQYIDNNKVLALCQRENSFGRTVWGYLCVELWEQLFVDQSAMFQKRYAATEPIVVERFIQETTSAPAIVPSTPPLSEHPPLLKGQ